MRLRRTDGYLVETDSMWMSVPPTSVDLIQFQLKQRVASEPEQLAQSPISIPVEKDFGGGWKVFLGTVTAVTEHESGKLVELSGDLTIVDYSGIKCTVERSHWSHELWLPHDPCAQADFLRRLPHWVTE